MHMCTIIHCMQISYSANVEYRSPQGVLVLFEDSGNVTAPLNSITIQALVPESSYQFRVSAVTSFGRGAEVSVPGHTRLAHGTYINTLHFVIIIYRNNK